VIDMTSGILHQPTASAAGAALPRGGLYRRLRRAAADAGLPTVPDGPAVTESDIAGLPSTVQRYLRFMRVVDRPRDWSFRVKFQGRFRIRPGARWLPAQAWQYNFAVPPARIFVLRLRVGHLVPFYGRDTYLRGRGRMVGTLFRRKMVDGSGTEFDHSELVIYLNDAVLLAPSMLLTPATSWTAVDDDSFDVALTDQGRTISGRVWTDKQGAPVNFVADRYATLPHGIVLAPWRTPVQRWQTDGDRPIPGPASVCYDLATGPYCYAEGRFISDSLAYNLAAPQL
jgi:hypothetical protein